MSTVLVLCISVRNVHVGIFGRRYCQNKADLIIEVDFLSNIPMPNHLRSKFYLFIYLFIFLYTKGYNVSSSNKF